MNTIKISILLLTGFIFNSCCVIPSFVDKKCIDYECNSTSISDTDFELASLKPGRRMDFFQLFYADTTAHIDVSKWKVLNGNKPKIEVGDTLKIYEDGFPGKGNSFIVSIKITQGMNSSGFFRIGSPIGQMLPKKRSRMSSRR